MLDLAIFVAVPHELQRHRVATAIFPPLERTKKEGDRCALGRASRGRMAGRRWPGEAADLVLTAAAECSSISTRSIASSLCCCRPRPWAEKVRTERLSSRFARVRVRVAHRDYQLTDNRPGRMKLLIEWLEGGRSRPNTGSQRFRKTSPSARWSTSPSCAGASSATIRSSSRRSGSEHFRRARMARLPPPRLVVHRGLPDS